MTPQSPKPGDVVLAIAGTAEWIRQGSDSLPENWWSSVPKGYQFAKSVPIQFLKDDLFAELVSESMVLAVSGDGKRVRVRSLSGRVSVFKVEHVGLLRKGGTQV
jgi:hypothetical protein